MLLWTENCNMCDLYVFTSVDETNYNAFRQLSTNGGDNVELQLATCIPYHLAGLTTSLQSLTWLINALICFHFNKAWFLLLTREMNIFFPSDFLEMKRIYLLMYYTNLKNVWVLMKFLIRLRCSTLWCRVVWYVLPAFQWNLLLSFTDRLLPWRWSHNP